MSTLQNIRKKIDEIDKTMLELLNLRAQKVKEIAEVKNLKKIPSFDPARERKIIADLVRENKGPLKKEDIESIMEEIFKIYRGMFKPLRIAYLGPEGTFTHQAAVKKFGEKSGYLHCKTIDNIFLEVEKGRADFGVVPIENSMEGVVTHTLDMFTESSLKITSEILIDVHHYLLSNENSLSKVKRIFSHPQATGQCWNWIMDNLPDVTITETESTAMAVKKARREKHSAAIGPLTTAGLYKIGVLAEKIEDYAENITRFLVIGSSFSSKTGKDKTSILLSIKDRVGALHDILLPFRENKINLTRIESRPSKKKAWDYVFFFDFIGHKDDDIIKDTLSKLEKGSAFLKILGSYPIGEKNQG
jgi:chorismate mutase / prephenate dehydratase